MKISKQGNKIVLIGAGNVAIQLGLILKSKGYKISQVYSPTEKSSQKLAALLKANAITNLKQIDSTSDLYIIAIKDDAIADVAKKIKLKNKIVIHTSGSTSMNVLKNVSENYGVFYPLQTFSKSKKVHFKNIPICIEANNKHTLGVLQKIAKSFSSNVQQVDSEQRKTIHVAAVFACNFTNHLYSIADVILSNNNLSFDILKPLIQETVNKIEKNNPVKMQTGPAVRGDKNTMHAHLKFLSKNKKQTELYTLISKSIIDSNKNNK